MAEYTVEQMSFNNGTDIFHLIPSGSGGCLDLSIAIRPENWIGNGPYTFTYSNSNITSTSAVLVAYKEGARAAKPGDIKITKTAGALTFTTSVMPIANIPLNIKIIFDADTDVITISADEVQTDAVSGEVNVQGALEALNSKMNSYSVCNIASFGHYIGSNGSLQTLGNYYVAEIPVTPNQTIKVLNSAPNAGAYSKFADASGNQVGDLVQGRWSPGWSSSVKVPSGAVKLQVSMYTETRYVAVEQS